MVTSDATKENLPLISPKTLARIAGLSYLLMSVPFVFAVQVRSRLVEAGDAAATVENIRASATLFRIAFVADLVSGAWFLLTALALYQLLKHVHPLAAVAMTAFVAVSTAVGYLNTLNQFSALTIATSPQYTQAFGRAGSNALAMMFADIQSNGLTIQELFWGMWLFPLGYLVIKSGYFPRLLGALLLVAGFSWVAQFFADFLMPAAPYFASFLGIGELIFAAWLVVKGVNVPASGASAPPVSRQIPMLFVNSTLPR